MIIEAVVTCLNYSDYLEHTLPWNLQTIDRVVVVTSPKDTKTPEIARGMGAECLITDAFYRYKSEMNKGAAINEGLKTLRRKDWLLLLDADIIVPPSVRKSLEESSLDHECLYGIDRCNCEDFSSVSPVLDETGFDQFSPMRRISIFGQTPPIGYFQLWHSAMIGFGPWYEETHNFADRTDVTFSKRFDKRTFLGGRVVHLDVHQHSGGVSWRGRTNLTQD